MPKRFTVYAQDLASDSAPVAIKYTKTDTGKGITIQGPVFEDLCQGNDYPYNEVKSIPELASKDYTDLSDPGIVLLIVSKRR